MVLIALIAACVINPSLLFFLTEEQQGVVADFQATYFTARNPLQGEGGGFDPVSLLSLALLLAECWAIILVI